MNPNEASANKLYNIIANTTVTLTGKLVLVRVIIGKKGASSNLLTIYSDTAATPEQKIVQIDTTSNVGSIELGVPCLTGIHAVTSAGTAGDVTLVYKEIS